MIKELPTVLTTFEIVIIYVDNSKGSFYIDGEGCQNVGQVLKKYLGNFPYALDNA